MLIRPDHLPDLKQWGWGEAELFAWISSIGHLVYTYSSCLPCGRWHLPKNAYIWRVPSNELWSMCAPLQPLPLSKHRMSPPLTLLLGPPPPAPRQNHLVCSLPPVPFTWHDVLNSCWGISVVPGDSWMKPYPIKGTHPVGIFSVISGAVGLWALLWAVTSLVGLLACIAHVGAFCAFWPFVCLCKVSVQIPCPFLMGMSVLLLSSCYPFAYPEYHACQMVLWKYFFPVCGLSVPAHNNILWKTF